MSIDLSIGWFNIYTSWIKVNRCVVQKKKKKKKLWRRVKNSEGGPNDFHCSNCGLRNGANEERW